MEIKYRKANTEDAQLLIDIYNASFYSDYIKYGECPAYGKTKQIMERSILTYPKFIIVYNGIPIGCISCKEYAAGNYEIGCLCVTPPYQGKGIGTQAIKFITEYFSNWNSFTLITPCDKEENVKFYTEKCGFKIASTETDGNIKVFRFLLQR